MESNHTYSCLIVDDDVMARRQLSLLVDKMDFLYLLGSLDHPLKAMEFLQNQEANIIFLDIEMPEVNGLELASNLDSDSRVIFTSSSKSYALEAFDMEAVDYLVKPVMLPRLVRAVKKAIRSIATPGSSIQKAYKDHIFLKENKRLVRTSIEDILYIESTGDYAKFFTKDEMILVHSTLKNIQKLLDPGIFVKVHRSFVVNIKKIVDIEDNSLVITDRVIPISRAQRSELMKHIQVI